MTRGVFLYTDKAQSGLNRNYYQLCESLEVPIEEIEVEGKMMKSMPDIIENSNSVVALKKSLLLYLNIVGLMYQGGIKEKE